MTFAAALEANLEAEMGDAGLEPAEKETVDPVPGLDSTESASACNTEALGLITAVVDEPIETERFLLLVFPEVMEAERGLRFKLDPSPDLFDATSSFINSCASSSLKANDDIESLVEGCTALRMGDETISPLCLLLSGLDLESSLDGVDVISFASFTAPPPPPPPVASSF